MKEQFVPYELALKLRALGFDEECINFWYPSGTMNNSVPIYGFQNWYKTNGYLNAPLWQQAFDWLDKEFGLFVSFGKIDNTRNFYYDFMIIDSKNRDYNDEDLIDSASRILDKGKYNTYEEARLECLKKLIEIITEQ